MSEGSNVTPLFGNRIDPAPANDTGDDLPFVLMRGCGSPPTYKAMVFYIKGFAEALSAVHAHSRVQLDGFPRDVDERFSRSLRAKGRLRWDNWERTILAEAIGWVDDPDDPHAWPDIDNLTPEQDRAALLALVPVLEDALGLPRKLARKLVEFYGG